MDIRKTRMPTNIQTNFTGEDLRSILGSFRIFQEPDTDGESSITIYWNWVENTCFGWDGKGDT